MTGRRHALIAASFGAIAAFFIGPVATGVAAAVIGLMVLTTHHARRRQADAARRRAVPVALDLLVLATGAGLTPHQTIHLLARTGPAPVRPAFAAVVRAMDRGVPLADALDELPRHLGSPVVAATDALAMSQRHGSPLREALAVITTEAARQRRAQADASARRLPVALSFPLVCCVLPAFVLLAIAPAVIAALRSLRIDAW